VAEFKLGTAVTDQNFIHKEIKSRLNLANAGYHAVRNLLSPSVMKKMDKIKVYRTIMLPVLYGCET
jgi:hypothetical protein